MKTKKRPTSLPALRKKAWAAFSVHIRSGAALHNGGAFCVTCNAFAPWAELHAGHFVHCSKQSPLSYDERNVHPQCRQCNYYGMQGEAMIHYTAFMQANYGPGIVNELLAIKHAKNYLKRADLEAIIERYK